jgi:hypothetical protein
MRFRTVESSPIALKRERLGRRPFELGIQDTAGISIEMVTEWAVSRRACALLLAVALALPSCGSDSYADAEVVDEDVAYEAAAESLEDQTFEDVGGTGECTEDCGGHNAGFEWAREHDVTDASECGGNSRSFEEGCEAYAEALEEQASEYESGEEY